MSDCDNNGCHHFHQRSDIDVMTDVNCEGYMFMQNCNVKYNMCIDFFPPSVSVFL